MRSTPLLCLLLLIVMDAHAAPRTLKFRDGDLENCIASSEIYDPSARTWQLTPGSLSQVRCKPLLVTLSDDRVIAIGGNDKKLQALDSTEIFDPKTGTWTPGPTMNQRRSDAAAAKLQDGRVLVVGGVDYTGQPDPLATAEIFDPVTNRWTLTAPLAKGRVASQHLFVLQDGRALMMGGDHFTGKMEPEIFDPARGTWTLLAAMPTPRDEFEAILLRDGRLWVGGGSLLQTDGASRTYASPLVDYFDPNANTWERGLEMLNGRAEFVAFTARDFVVYAGGIANFFLNENTPMGLSSGESVVPADFYVWGGTLPLNEGRAIPFKAVLPGGVSLIIGGVTSVGTQGRVLKTVERLYATGYSTEPWFGWVPDSEMIEYRFAPGVAVLSTGQVLVAAGRGGQPF